MAQKIEVITKSEKRRRFSDAEKLSILNESKSAPVVEVCRKYDISASLFYLWRKQFLTASSSVPQSLPSPFAQISVAEVTTEADSPAVLEPIRLHLYDEMLIELPASTDPKELVNLIRMLRR